MFYFGEIVSGWVKLYLKEYLKIKELWLECCGEVYVNWFEYLGSYICYYYNWEWFFSMMVVILGEGEFRSCVN